MIFTDDTKRRVARNIRDNYARGGFGYEIASAANIARAVGLDAEMPLDDIELWWRLADLIEPNATEDPKSSESARNCSDPTLPCEGRDRGDVSAGSDRGTHVDPGALLMIADRLDGKAAMLLKLNSTDHSRQRKSVRRECARDFIMASDLIRAALGDGGRE